MVKAAEKVSLVLRMLVNPRLRRDVKALKYAIDGYKSYAWELCKDIGIVHLLKEGSTINKIMRKKKIKNRKFLECLLDFLVGNGVLKYDDGRYFFLKNPKPFVSKKYRFLQEFYPNSVQWTNILRSKAKETLQTGKKHFEAGFENKKFLELWDGIMRESPWSFRKMAIEKFSKKINAGANILDLGCGSGTSIEQILLECKKPVNITGIDGSSKSIKKAKKRMEELYKITEDPIVKGNINRIEFKKYDLSKKFPCDKKYNVVFMSLLVNHIPEDKREVFFKNVRNLLKEKGVAVVYQIINKSKFERAAMWVMHTVPTHQEYPFRHKYIDMLSKIFTEVKSYLDGVIIVAKK